MRFLPVLLIAPLLAACQSCKKPEPPPRPPPTPHQTDASAQEDASVAASDAGTVDAAPEAAPPAANPCMESLAGAAHAFCDYPGDILLSTSVVAPASKSKLTTIKSEAVGKVRLAVRHSNGSKTAKMKTVVVLVNNGKVPGVFTILRKGVSGPSSNAQELERLAAERWASSTVKTSVTVAVGKPVRFDASVEVGLPEGYATMGLYEYSFTQPHTVTVCFLGDREDFSVCAGL